MAGVAGRGSRFPTLTALITPFINCQSDSGGAKDSEVSFQLEICQPGFCSLFSAEAKCCLNTPFDSYQSYLMNQVIRVRGFT